jgi:hypothetical protein
MDEHHKEYRGIIQLSQELIAGQWMVNFGAIMQQLNAQTLTANQITLYICSRFRAMQQIYTDSGWNTGSSSINSLAASRQARCMLCILHRLSTTYY